MKRKQLTFAAVLVATGGNVLNAQYSEPTPTRRVSQTGLAGPGKDTSYLAEFLQQATLDWSSDGTVARIKLARVWAEIWPGREIPISILANPTVLIPAGRDSVSLGARELLNQFGGLLNVSASRSFSPPGAIPGHVGLFAELRASAKVIQFQSSADEIRGAPAGQIGASATWLVPLWGNSPTVRRALGGARRDTVSQQGVFSLNLRLTAVGVGGGDYFAFYRAATSSNEVSSVFGVGQADLALHLFDIGYVTAGYTLASVRALPRTGFLGFTIVRRPRSNEP
jgi:hypothetical protein